MIIMNKVTLELKHADIRAEIDTDKKHTKAMVK